VSSEDRPLLRALWDCPAFIGCEWGRCRAARPLSQSSVMSASAVRRGVRGATTADAADARAANARVAKTSTPV
jgi:hypothetical protein